MSWASRRRFFYISGITFVFGTLIGIPFAFYFYKAPSCTDGKMNQGETLVDRGGPCPLLDPRAMTPIVASWARSFRVRDGVYSAAAYIQNPNENAGVMKVAYTFKLYDANNVEIIERMGDAFIMPGSVTPVFQGQIQSGNREVSRTFFEFTSPLVWQRLLDTGRLIEVSNKSVVDTDTMPRVTARAKNTSVSSLTNITFVAAVYDTAGNVFAASQTALTRLEPGETKAIVFTWTGPFGTRVGHVDILPLSRPQEY